MVTQYGHPISSILAYRLPMEPAVSKKDIMCFFRLLWSSSAFSFRPSFFMRGNTPTFSGASSGFSFRTVLSSSFVYASIMNARNARSTPCDGSAATQGITFFLVSSSKMLRSFLEYAMCCVRSNAERSAMPWISFHPNGNLYSMSKHPLA